jgi:hypothetical protein
MRSGPSNKSTNIRRHKIDHLGCWQTGRVTDRADLARQSRISNENDRPLRGHENPSYAYCALSWISLSSPLLALRQPIAGPETAAMAGDYYTETGSSVLERKFAQNLETTFQLVCG